MKVNEFVKKFGFEKAKKVIGNMPLENSARYRPHDGRYSATFSSGDTVSTMELKKLIESWELVEFSGGLDIAKELEKEVLGDMWDDLQQAIADVESCL